MRESASADYVAATRHPEHLKKIMNYDRDETGMFWKNMPVLKFLYKKKGTSPALNSQRKVSLFLSVIMLWAICMIMCMLICYFISPWVLQEKNKNHLTVFSQSFKEAWVTAGLV